MREAWKAFLSTIAILSSVFCVFVLSIWGCDPAGGWQLVGGAAIIAIVSSALLFRAHRPKEKIPDFLRRISPSPLEANGICLLPRIVRDEGRAYLEVWYQNRHERPASVQVAVAPSLGFLMTRRKIDPVGMAFACREAAFGVARMPVAIATEYQGSEQRFDIGADVVFPGGKGRKLRYRDGVPVGDAEFDRVADHALSVVGLVVGVQKIHSPASFETILPRGVAERAPDDAPVEVAELWALGAPATSLADLPVPPWER